MCTKEDWGGSHQAEPLTQVQCPLLEWKGTASDCSPGLGTNRQCAGGLDVTWAVSHCVIFGIQFTSPEKELLSPPVKQQQILIFILENGANKEKGKWR